MDVIFRIIRWIVLNNPVNVREVKTSLRYISTQQYASSSLAEFKVRGRPLLLLLLSMDVFYWDVNVIKQVTIEFDCVATAHEYHYLLFHVLL